MPSKIRLDHLLTQKNMVQSRSQAENLINLGLVEVEGKIIKKAGYFINEQAKIKLLIDEKYVSRAALKLASVAKILKLNFKDKIVLDVGSSTGGFSDFALHRGAKKSICIEVGTNQLHPSLKNNPNIELHEQTDIRDVKKLSSMPNVVLIDVSFISLKLVLPAIAKLVNKNTEIVAMLKPQFEAGESIKNKGVIKNERMRRNIMKDFENYVMKSFVIIDKCDSSISGAKGNTERFYLLKTTH